MSFKKDHSGNLKSHLKSKHPNLHIAIQEAEKQEQQDSKRQKVLDTTQKSTLVSISQKELVDACVELATVNGRPLSIFEDSGFKKILDPLCKALDITINRQNIKKFIQEEGKKIRSEVRAAIGDKFYWLKADTATRQNRCILGVNVQFYDKKEIKVHTLEMKEVVTGTSANELKSYMIEIVKSYGLSLKNCLGFSTDNGRNFVKTGKILDILQALGDEEDEIDYSSIEYIDKKDIVNYVQATGHSFFQSIECWPHTIQLAITNFFDTNEMQRIMSDLDKLTKVLRRPTIGI